MAMYIEGCDTIPGGSRCRSWRPGCPHGTNPNRAVMPRCSIQKTRNTRSRRGSQSFRAVYSTFFQIVHRGHAAATASSASTASARKTRPSRDHEAEFRLERRLPEMGYRRCRLCSLRFCLLRSWLSLRTSSKSPVLLLACLSFSLSLPRSLSCSFSFLFLYPNFFPHLSQSTTFTKASLLAPLSTYAKLSWKGVRRVRTRGLNGSDRFGDLERDRERERRRRREWVS